MGHIPNLTFNLNASPVWGQGVHRHPFVSALNEWQVLGGPQLPNDSCFYLGTPTSFTVSFPQAEEQDSHS